MHCNGNSILVNFLSKFKGERRLNSKLFFFILAAFFNTRKHFSGVSNSMPINFTTISDDSSIFSKEFFLLAKMFGNIGPFFRLRVFES